MDRLKADYVSVEQLKTYILCEVLHCRVPDVFVRVEAIPDAVGQQARHAAPAEAWLVQRFAA